MVHPWPAYTRSLWFSLLTVIVAGSVLGTLAKFADESSIPGASDLGTYFGFWILAVTAITVTSHARARAVFRSVAFLFAMVASYYGVTFLLFGFVPTRLLLAWILITLLLAPSFAALVWPAKRTGWRSAFAAALPVGLLFFEAWSLRWVIQLHPLQFAFDLISAVVLLLILPVNHTQRARVLGLFPFIMMGARVAFDYIWTVAARAM